MEIRCRCTACQTKFKIDGKYAGKKARCPKCQQIVEVPSENIEASTTSLSSLATAQPATGNSTLVPPKAAAKTEPAARPEAMTPAAAAEAAPFAGFQIQPAAIAAKGDSAAAGKRRKKSNAAPLIVAGSVAASLLLIGGMVAVIALSGSVPAGGSAGTAGENSRAPSSGVLVLDWPDGDRQQAALSIDGRRETFAQSGELKFTLAAGTHRVFIQRRGFEPFEAEVTLAGGGTEQVTPQWSALTNNVATPSQEASARAAAATLPMPGAGGFPIGTGVSVEIAGFEGWLQKFDEAKAEAKKSNGTVLLAFTCSDVQPASKMLAAALKTPAAVAELEGTVRVVIDFPRSDSAQELVHDEAQNLQLAEEFGLERLPAVVVTDADGRAFASQTEWDSGFDGLERRLGDWKRDRQERDALLAAAGQGATAEQLEAAVKAMQWLDDHGVWQGYRTEIAAWLAAAQRLDPANEQGRLECFFSPQWLLRLLDLDGDDRAAIEPLLAEMAQWRMRKFRDPDRGMKMHLAAAKLLEQLKRFDDAAAEVEAALSYQPRDGELAILAQQYKLQLANRELLGNGSGFLVSAAGYVLTNRHVADAPGKLAIRLPDGNEDLPVEVVAKSDRHDIALLKFNPPADANLSVLPIATSPIGRGTEVAAFGFPNARLRGFKVKFAEGTITGLPEESNNSMYMLSVKINPGNSGGPLCDKRGNVVGLVAAKTRGGLFSDEDSYGLAIPADIVAAFLDQHLPATAPRSPPQTGDLRPWTDVDPSVSRGVLLILVKAAP